MSLGKRTLLATIILILATSCTTQKKINRSSSSQSAVEHVETADTSTGSVSDRELAEAIRSVDKDIATMLSFDSLSTVEILPDGTIRAQGYNPKFQQKDLTKSKEETNKYAEHVESFSSDRSMSMSKGSVSEEESTSKDITRTNYSPLIFAITGCLIIVYCLWFFYRKLKPLL